MARELLSLGLAAAIIVTAACSNTSGFDEVRGYGPAPTLTEPDTSGSLGLAYSTSNRLPGNMQEGMFVGQHGSWNRDPRAGYRVIFVPFSGGKPSGMPIDVLTGFVRGDDAMGRPVGVALDARGGLLVADDIGNVVWRVTGASAMTRR
jgi:glucose/arabinose dehydrogenase